jgi:uncharacterized protein (TIGR02118 family)
VIRLTVLYPKTAASTFDMEYYLNKHVPLVLARLSSMGLRRLEVDAGLGGVAPDQPASFAAIGYLTYDTLEDLQRGLAVHGAELMEDIHKFTNVEPLMQVNRIERQIEPATA